MQRRGRPASQGRPSSDALRRSPRCVTLPSSSTNASAACANAPPQVSDLFNFHSMLQGPNTPHTTHNSIAILTWDSSFYSHSEARVIVLKSRSIVALSLPELAHHMRLTLLFDYVMLHHTQVQKCTQRRRWRSSAGCCGWLHTWWPTQACFLPLLQSITRFLYAYRAFLIQAETDTLSLHRQGKFPRFLLSLITVRLMTRVTIVQYYFKV